MTGVKQDKVAVWLSPEEIDLLKWVWENYGVFLALREANIKGASATVNFNPQGKPITVVTNVVLYRRKVDDNRF